MLFDKEAFLIALAAQCETFGLEHGKVWQLAPNVFAALIRSRGTAEWSAVYYFDDREVKLRDKESGEQYMAREVQLLMVAGFSVGLISEDTENHARVAYFEEDMLGGYGANILNCATQLFARTDNGEIEWSEGAEPIEIIAEAA
jgi:hypothetical protein